MEYFSNHVIFPSLSYPFTAIYQEIAQADAAIDLNWVKTKQQQKTKPTNKQFNLDINIFIAFVSKTIVYDFFFF